MSSWRAFSLGSRARKRITSSRTGRGPMLRKIRRRAWLIAELWQASQRGRRQVALHRDHREGEPIAIGRLRFVGLRGVRLGDVQIRWSAIARVTAWPDVRCPNCLREHGPLEDCFLGVIAGVLVERDGREINPELLAQVEVDEMWDLYGGPAADWLEDSLDALEAANAM